MTEYKQCQEGLLFYLEIFLSRLVKEPEIVSLEMHSVGC